MDGIVPETWYLTQSDSRGFGQLLYNLQGYSRYSVLSHLYGVAAHYEWLGFTVMVDEDALTLRCECGDKWVEIRAYDEVGIRLALADESVKLG